MARNLKVFWSFCLVFCLFSVSALAASKSYYLDELGMSIDIPSDYVVFTRDIKANDPNLRAYGLTKDGMSSLMLERSIYSKRNVHNVQENRIPRKLLKCRAVHICNRLYCRSYLDGLKGSSG